MPQFNTGVLSFDGLHPTARCRGDANERQHVRVDGARLDDGTMTADRMVTVTVDQRGRSANGLGRSDRNRATQLRTTTENGTDAVGTYMASGPGSDMAMWSLDGDDMSAFRISTGGELTFASPPNYEMPTDMGMDNDYNVTVIAKSGEDMDDHEVTVTVANVQEGGGISLGYDGPDRWRAGNRNPG